MGMSVTAVAGLIPLLLIQYFIYKKIFDPIYFNSQYYSSYELSIFDSFPLSLVKTIGYIKAIVFPDLMRKKFKTIYLNRKKKNIQHKNA